MQTAGRQSRDTTGTSEVKNARCRFSCATETGRSGVNLDLCGFKQVGTSAIGWVIDGVSPIVFRDKDWNTYYRFRDAGQVLKSYMEKSEWNSTSEQLRAIADEIRNSEASKLFLDGPFFLRPLFSVAVIRATWLPDNACELEVALYGDCAVYVRNAGRTRCIEYRNLNTLKSLLERLFRLTRAILPARVDDRLRKTVLATIRILQTWCGAFRVFSVQRYYEPCVVERMLVREPTQVVAMSDGATWYARESVKNLESLLTAAICEGPMCALALVRSSEDRNRGFGRFDDATILVGHVGRQQDGPL